MITLGKREGTCAIRYGNDAFRFHFEAMVNENAGLFIIHTGGMCGHKR